jgi:sigma-B regulation protein RsbU (phosphoserine phosphatase)
MMMGHFRSKTPMEVESMSQSVNAVLKEQLVQRREKLDAVLAERGHDAELKGLLTQVDAALARMNEGTYGLCLTCHDPIEQDRLLADPLLEFCLDHLTPRQQRALEEDMSLAAQVQRGLLPSLPFAHCGWEAHYHYQAAGAVSGDYCDLVPVDGGFYFFLGDVSGKGVAASILMSQLHALFRALVEGNPPLDGMVARANRFFCETTLPMHYATLVCGKGDTQGQIEICNAGHPPFLILKGRGVTEGQPSNLPVGAFCETHFRTERIRLEPGDAVLAYTDGLTEAKDSRGGEYGRSRLRDLGAGLIGRDPRGIVEACLEDMRRFTGGARLADDLTVMALRRK